MWERGLKHQNVSYNLWQQKSLPMWECGLKLRSEWVGKITYRHSPCGSVDWNFISHYTYFVFIVTPHVGVWIETSYKVMKHNGTCHSPCGSVDWNNEKLFAAERPEVTPRVGVWIETECIRFYIDKLSVTPRVGVWIETSQCRQATKTLPCHSPCGSVDWNRSFWVRCQWWCCHSPCGSVDWNKAKSSIVPSKGIHSPCGSVDWNEFDDALFAFA